MFRRRFDGLSHDRRATSRMIAMKRLRTTKKLPGQRVRQKTITKIMTLLVSMVDAIKWLIPVTLFGFVAR